MGRKRKTDAEKQATRNTYIEKLKEKNYWVEYRKQHKYINKNKGISLKPEVYYKIEALKNDNITYNDFIDGLLKYIDFNDVDKINMGE